MFCDCNLVSWLRMARLPRPCWCAPSCCFVMRSSSLNKHWTCLPSSAALQTSSHHSSGNQTLTIWWTSKFMTVPYLTLTYSVFLLLFSPGTLSISVTWPHPHQHCLTSSPSPSPPSLWHPFPSSHSAGELTIMIYWWQTYQREGNTSWWEDTLFQCTQTGDSFLKGRNDEWLYVCP